jgi:PAS domain S-box-containing protein
LSEKQTKRALLAENADLRRRLEEAEEALRAINSELIFRDERFRVLIENLHSGVALIDESGQFMVCNQSFLKLFGLAEDTTILNVNSLDWSAWHVSKEDGKTLLHVNEHPVRKAALSGKPVRNSVVGVRLPSNGDVIWMLMNVEPVLKPDGSLRYLIATYYDITELKKNDQIKDEFISLVAHELRTPVTIIMGSVRTAMSKGLTPEEVHELLQNAAEGADSLFNIMENILELSRYQVGRLKLRVEPVNINNVAKSVIEKLKTQFINHQFLRDISRDLPAAEADPLRVERILHNLVENACKYSPIESQIKVSCRSEGDFIVTSVIDQGKGISAEDQLKLFGQFQQRDAASSIKTGVGLGLLVCKRLVESQGGWIKVESELGKGSVFSFALKKRVNINHANLMT